MGWKLPYYAPVNVNKGRLPKDRFSKSTLELIADSNQLDIELYKFASQKLKQEIELYGEKFQSYLRRLKLINKIYGMVVSSSPRRISRDMRMRRRRKKSEMFSI